MFNVLAYGRPQDALFSEGTELQSFQLVVSVVLGGFRLHMCNRSLSKFMFNVLAYGRPQDALFSKGTLLHTLHIVVNEVLVCLIHRKSNR